MGRLLLIGISALCGGLLFIGLFVIAFPVRMPDWLGFSLFGLFSLGAGAAAWCLCGRPSLKPTDFSPPDYEKLGLLTHETFSVRRGFEVAEYEDECPQFFLELEGGGVLFLCGQYLYEYQETSDDPELNQPARFPCTRFDLRRHKTEHWVHSIICRGGYLAPETKVPALSKAQWKALGSPADGEILPMSYNELRARVAGKKSAPTKNA